jgi:hypothetical protein
VNLLCQLLSTLAQYRQAYRGAVHCLRNRHEMVRQSDGPVCGVCGFSWLWKDRSRFDFFD